MPNFLDEFKTSHTLRKTIEAEDYNRVRLALSRLNTPLELELTSMRCLEMLITDKFWLCTNSCVGNQPIMAWTAFETLGRLALDAPVACELRLYHHQAGLVMGEVLESLGHSLDTMMDTKKNNV